MLVLFTQSTQHLRSRINLPVAQYEIKQFSDGELYIKINQSLEDENIWVITETGAPAKNMLELFFLLNALVRSGTQKINIIFTYFGYARQAVAEPSEPASAEIICNILKMFPLGTTYCMHIHDPATMHRLLKFDDIVDMSFFGNIAKDFDVIAAPDKGAHTLAEKIAKDTEKPSVFVYKIRPEQEKVTIKSVEGTVRNKKVLLVDDIVSTGTTLIKASKALKYLGATAISAAVTHGVFSPGSLKKLQDSPLDKIHITNTIKQTPSQDIIVYDIAPFIESILLES